MKQVVPPVIRVFISSTFADMNQERDYFNTVIAPKISRLCSERGVSFFSVDLRWGITEEDQIADQVLPICLREVDNCRPFFIGIIGNRYGSIPQRINETTKSNFPWLSHLGDRSVTELEMYYGVLMHENKSEMPSCAFFFRSDKLSDQFFSDLEPEDKLNKLSSLKQRIRQNTNIPSYDYSSLKEFEEELISAISSWLDESFPNTDSVHNARKNWYNNELLRDYIKVDDLHRFLNGYCSNTQHSLMIYGKGKRGKTTALTAWLPDDSEKILINCSSDEAYHYWPAIAHEIVNELKRIDENVGFPEFKAYASMFFRMMEGLHNTDAHTEHTMYYVTDRELNEFRCGFVSWLKQVRPKHKVYIIINDLNLVSDSGASYMNWLPSETNENVHIICSANDDAIVENVRMLGWNIKEMPLFSKEDVSSFLDSYMAIYGKKMTMTQKNDLLETPLLNYLGCQKFIIRYFNNYANFENLDHLTGVFGKFTSEKELYGYVLDTMFKRLSSQEVESVKTALSILSLTSYGLSEETLFNLVQNFIETDPISWAKIHIIFEQFQIITADTWKIWDQNLIDVVLQYDVDLYSIHSVLGNYFRTHMDTTISHSSEGIKQNTEYAKAALYHYCEAKNWEALSTLLADAMILYYLTKMEFNSVRSSWMHLLIASDLDVAEEMLRIFKCCKSEYAGIEGIEQTFTSLMYDLELFEIAHKASMMADTVESSMLHSLYSSMPDEMIAIYNRFCKMKNMRQFHKLLLDVRSFIRQYKSELNAEELCAFYALEAESELNVHDIEGGLKTAYQYQKAAIEAMDDYEILKAIMFRGEILYLSSRYSEAEDIFVYCQKLALDAGYIRQYLSTLNMVGMCYYRRKKFAVSIEAFRLCIRIWKKLNNQFEFITCRMNLCNALYLSGDLSGAIRESEELCAEIEKLPKKDYASQFIRVRENLGLYYRENHEPEKAEAVYLQVIDISEKMEYMTPNTYHGLIGLYKEQQQNTKAIHVYLRLIDRLYQNKVYDVLAEAVKDCIDLMIFCRYRHEAKALEKKWKDFFEGIPGGHELFELTMQQAQDPLLEEQLKEELVIARSENDHEKCGELFLTLAALKPDNDSCTYELYINAMEAFSACGNSTRRYECACQALCTLIASDPKDKRIQSLCADFSLEDKLIVQNWLRLKEESITDDSCTEVFDQIIQHSEPGHYLSARCFLSELCNLIKRLSKEKLMFLLEWMRASSLYDKFTDTIAKIFRSDFEANFDYLRRNYVSPQAEDLLAFYEKMIALLEILEPDNAGAIAGNIALIYRRRKDKFQTFSCHEMAIRVFRNLNKHKDRFIEMMNLATAYRDFGETEKSIELLREALRDPEIDNYNDIRAAIAGNLASGLTNWMQKENVQVDIEEIAECFALEESYFEKSGEARELVISLLNQVNFYLNDKKKYSIIQKKYKKAEKIITQYHLSEFSQILHRLKPAVFPDQTPSQFKTKKNLFDQLRNKFQMTKTNKKKLITELIDDADGYTIEEIKAENDKTMHVLCFPKKEIPIVKVNLHLGLSVEKAYQLKYLFIMQPMKIHNKIDILMQQYVEWWNEQDIYELHISQNDNGNLIILEGSIESGNWQEVRKIFEQIRKFWYVDVMNMSLGAIGMTDLDDLQELKLKILKDL